MPNSAGSWLLIVLLLGGAAALEVGGDALIRLGLQGRSGWRVVLGCAVLAAYGLAINVAPGRFARLLGSYVAVFAVLAVLGGRWWFGEAVSAATWYGLILIVLGGLIIQLGAN